MDNTTEFVRSLRELADFYEKTPAMPLPEIPLEVSIFGCNDRKAVQYAARLLGTVTKRIDQQFNLYWLERAFGLIRLRVVTSQASVCTPRVVGTRHVPKEVRSATPERIMPAHEVEVVEWDCEESLLASK